ncbi:MAG: ATP synthase subunit a [candidate division TM6 bacterium GW2011_GWE2_42_60]|nr:MAG: ATP synthase subunit a [candidate division TM6 bacterium GW2011_GWE2_42_60]HBY05610.1 hypothetical protein [Candidatus Dependentiae bacterium]
MNMDIMGHGEPLNLIAPLGLSLPFFTVNQEVVVNTWAALGVLLVLALLGRFSLRKPDSIGGHITIWILRSFMGMVHQAFGRVKDRYFYYVSALFIFLVICNSLIIIPGFEEPTKDPYTTFAFGIIAFSYTQIETLRAHGLIGFLQEYFKMPLALFPSKKLTFGSIIMAILRGLLNLIVGLVSFPLELLSKLSSLMSLSLRLFGNIFGGSMIATLLKQAGASSLLIQVLTLATGLNLIVTLFFGLFEAFIQAFVFSTLSLTYISMGTQSSEPETSHAHSERKQ